MIWKGIPGFLLYEVSNTGVVRNIKSLRELKQSETNEGYFEVCLSRQPVNCYIRVHILVMLAFVGPRPIGLVINHLDGDKKNNHLENLEYCTHSHNIKHAFKLNPELKAVAAKSAAYGRSTPQYQQAFRKWLTSPRLKKQLQDQAKIASVASKTPEAIEKWRQKNVGQKRSEESKQRISESLIGKKHSPERCEKNRQAKLGHKQTEATIKKRSEAMKAVWARKKCL